MGDSKLNQSTYARGQFDNIRSIGELVRPLLDGGTRESKINGGVPRKLTPTNSERFNRSLRELSSSGFKVHCLLWKWRGAPARGKLPYFTIHSLSKFTGLTRPTVRKALDELIRKGWIGREPYSVHKKNSLYRLIPIREVPLIV